MKTQKELLEYAAVYGWNPLCRRCGFGMHRHPVGERGPGGLAGGTVCWKFIWLDPLVHSRLSQYDDFEAPR